MGIELTPDQMIERSFWDYFWVPDDVTVVNRPEITYYSCPRDVGYLNMVTRIGVVDHQNVTGLVEEVLAAHRGRSSTWVIPPGGANAWLEGQLRKASYSPIEYRGCVLLPGDYEHESKKTSFRVRVVDSMERLRDCVRVGQEAFGATDEISDTQMELDLALCTGGGSRVHRMVAYEAASEQPVSTGSMTLFHDMDFTFLWGGGTIPEYRNRGAYSAVLTARIERALGQGTGLAGMCARADTSAQIVTRYGFRPHGTFHLWSRDARHHRAPANTPPLGRRQ